MKRWRVGLSLATLSLVLDEREVVLAQLADNPTFEVASIRANKSARPPSPRFPLSPGDAYVPGKPFLGNQPAADRLPPVCIQTLSRRPSRLTDLGIRRAF